MPLLGLLWGFIQICLFFSVLAVAIEFYNISILTYKVPDVFLPVIFLGVVGVSIFKALSYVVSGGAMGLISGNGGWSEGLQMGLLLGTGFGMARLWPFTLAWSIGIFVAEGPWFHLFMFSLTTAVLFGLHVCMRFLWNLVQDGKFPE